jgi:lipoate synthase
MNDKFESASLENGGIDFGNLMKQLPQMSPTIPMQSNTDFNIRVEDSPMYQKVQEAAEYQKRSYEVLQAIEKNTANLQVIVDLIHTSNENQDEIIELLSEIQSMAKAKDKDEAGTIYTIVQTYFSNGGGIA